MQEAPRKDVERGFGVLQAWWAIVCHLARTWSLKTMHEVMTCYVIMHNMIVDDEHPDGRNAHLFIKNDPSLLQFQNYMPTFSNPKQIVNAS